MPWEFAHEWPQNASLAAKQGTNDSEAEAKQNEAESLLIGRLFPKMDRHCLKNNKVSIMPLIECSLKIERVFGNKFLHLLPFPEVVILIFQKRHDVYFYLESFSLSRMSSHQMLSTRKAMVNYTSPLTALALTEFFYSTPTWP